MTRLIKTFSSTIRRKEMDAVLTCMVDEKIGPGELNMRLSQSTKEFFECAGAVAFRSPAIALKYALECLSFNSVDSKKIMISALAPSWHFLAIESLGFEPLVLDVSEETGLVSVEEISRGISNGGRLLLFHETMGILPSDVQKIRDFGIPIIEDVSHSIGSVFSNSEVKAGMFGVFSILGLEERDFITGGGGGILIAPERREWFVLKKIAENLPPTDVLPDINCALAWVQMKEFKKNAQVRKQLYDLYLRALSRRKNRTFLRQEESIAIWGFPVVLESAVKDVKQYCAKKGIEITLAYEDSVLAKKNQDFSEEELKLLKTSRSLLLRCVLFPLYPRLSAANVEKIVRVLETLP